MKSPLEVNVDKLFIDFQWPYDAQIIPRRFQVARRGLLLDPNLLIPPGRAQRASERSERSERSDHDLYRALRFLSIFSCVSIASVSCTFLDIFRVLLFVILVRASRSDAKTGFFFIVFSLVFSRFFGLQATPRYLYVGPMLELVLGGVLEASWSDLGRFLGGQDGPKTATRRPKTATRRPKTRQ